jgi:hypothetical protein
LGELGICVPGRFLGIIGWNLSVSNSNSSHVAVFRFSFITSRHILEIPLKWSVTFLNS